MAQRQRLAAQVAVLSVPRLRNLTLAVRQQSLQTALLNSIRCVIMTRLTKTRPLCAGVSCLCLLPFEIANAHSLELAIPHESHLQQVYLKLRDLCSGLVCPSGVHRLQIWHSDQ